MTLEYFLLLAAIVVVTLVGVSTFHTDIANIFKEKVFKEAVKHMPLDDVGPANPTDGSGGGGSGGGDGSGDGSGPNDPKAN